MVECDVCGNEGADVLVCSPRPSDLHEIVCVMLMCVDCVGQPLTVPELIQHYRSGGGTVGATREVWDAFFEQEDVNHVVSAAHEFGFWFLTL